MRTAGQVNRRWYGDGTEIRTAEGKLYLDSVLDMASRRILGFALGAHHGTALAYGALAMAVAVRGGAVPGVVFHTGQVRQYTARAFRQACERLSVRQSMGRPGSALDNAVIESWHSTLEFELRSLHAFATGHRHGPQSRPGSRTTTTPGGTPPSACAAPWITNSPWRERTPPLALLRPLRVPDRLFSLKGAAHRPHGRRPCGPPLTPQASAAPGSRKSGAGPGPAPPGRGHTKASPARPSSLKPKSPRFQGNPGGLDGGRRDGGPGGGGGPAAGTAEWCSSCG
jgi:transposase InsO family protein